jgi:GTP-binding protein
MKFIDTAEIQVKAGDGGTGMSHFRREANVAFGGPDGGNGGRGGNIIFEGHEGLHTLLDFRFNRIHEAEPGGKGGTNNRQGKVGEDLVLKVPCGTVVYDSDSGEMIGEVIKHEQQLVVASGGKGGVGNHVFVSSSNQAPTKTIPPAMGERKSIRLELKMLADVGIIGAPNAGKSTLITVISAARPKVADYPFTTLVPNLGVVSHKDADPFVVADVPGLIAGASEGKGLGHEFLRHIERTRVLIHLVDASQETSEAMISDYEGILTELHLYDPELLKRPRLTALTKFYLVIPEGEDEYLNEDAIKEFRAYLKAKNVDFMELSSARRLGISNMLDKVVELLDTLKEGH